MTGRFTLRAALGCLLAALLCGAQASAHPLGLTSVNRYLGVRPHGQELEVDYLLDLAEMPAYAEIETLDVDHDSAVTPAERDRYLDGVRARVLEGVQVTVDGVRVPLREVFRSLDAPAGQNGLSTLRVVFEFRAALPHPEATRLTVHAHDGQYATRGGWRELAGLGSAQWVLVSSSLPAGAPRAGAGLAYPTGALDAMPRQDDADFTFARGAGASGVAISHRAAESDGEGARLIGLLRGGRGGWSFWLFALGLAFALGAGHALSPGHGKTLVGAWLVGSRASVRHALILGLTVTVTHTASVFALGLVALSIERTIGSEKLLRALEFTSGALVAGIAVSQLPSRWRRFRGASSTRFKRAKHAKHAMVRVAPGHTHAHTHGLTHDHGDGRVHSHAVPDEISLRSLVALGISGGMVPCPGALVVLLAAIAMHRIAAGLCLLVAFSLGLAFVLSALGALFVTARRLLDRVPTEGRIARTLPVLSSLVVMSLGLGIIVRSLSR